MRDYCRVYHTSLDHLSALPLGQLFAELEDAAEDLAAEQREREKRIERDRAIAKSRNRSKARHRRR